MWFAKWFGGRSVQDDEPARFPPASAQTRTPAKSASSKAGAAKDGAAKQGKSGFDPYNSGDFDRNKAWERVMR